MYYIVFGFVSVAILQGVSSQILSYGIPRNDAPSLANVGTGANQVNLLNIANSNLANVNSLNRNTPVNIQNANGNIATLQSLINGAGNNANIGLANNANSVANGANFRTGGNIVSLSLGYPNSLPSGSIDGRAFGVQIIADDLQVRGQLKAAGKLPFYGTVAVNGQFPTEGSGTVSYNCGKPNA